MLYTVKTIKAIAIAFPFFILLCIPARLYILPRFFLDYELIVLDGSPEEVEKFVRQWAIQADERDAEDDEEGKPLVPGPNTDNEDETSDEPEPEEEPQPPASAQVPMPEQVIDMSDKGEEVDTFAGHDISGDALEVARRKSGRVDRRARKKTVSDLSGMLNPKANETVWSHVLR